MQERRYVPGKALDVRSTVVTSAPSRTPQLEPMGSIMPGMYARAFQFCLDIRGDRKNWRTGPEPALQSEKETGGWALRANYRVTVPTPSNLVENSSTHKLRPQTSPAICTPRRPFVCGTSTQTTSHGNSVRR